MRASINKAIISGYLAKKGDFVSSDDENKSYVKFIIGTFENYKDKEGNDKSIAEWHKITCFGKKAEYVEKNWKKGDLVYVEGVLNWVENDKKDKVAEIIVAQYGTSRLYKILNGVNHKKEDNANNINQEANIENQELFNEIDKLLQNDISNDFNLN